MDKDYIHSGGFSARRRVDLRQAKLLDGGIMGHDQMEMAVGVGSKDNHFCKNETEEDE